MKKKIKTLSLTFNVCIIFCIAGILESKAALIDLAGNAEIVSDITIGGITFTGSSTAVAELKVHQNENGLGVRQNTSRSTNQIDGLSNGNETLKGTAPASSIFRSTTLSQIRNNDNAIIKIDGIEVFNGDIPDSGLIDLGGISGTTIEYTVKDASTDDYKVLQLDFDPAGAAVPEPGSFALLGLGLMALWGIKRRKE